jgi:hypothetical protein
MGSGNIARCLEAVLECLKGMEMEMEMDVEMEVGEKRHGLNGGEMEALLRMPMSNCLMMVGREMKGVVAHDHQDLKGYDDVEMDYLSFEYSEHLSYGNATVMMMMMMMTDTEQREVTSPSRSTSVTTSSSTRNHVTTYLKFLQGFIQHEHDKNLQCSSVDSSGGGGGGGSDCPFCQWKIEGLLFTAEYSSPTGLVLSQD